MVIDSWTLYWITRLDAISSLSCAVGGGILVCLVALTLLRTAAICCENDEEAVAFVRATKGLQRWLLGFTLFLATIVLLTPTTKQMAVIYMLPKVVNDGAVQEECSEVYGLLKDWLQEQVGDDDKCR